MGRLSELARHRIRIRRAQQVHNHFMKNSLFQMGSLMALPSCMSQNVACAVKASQSWKSVRPFAPMTFYAKCSLQCLTARRIGFSVFPPQFRMASIRVARFEFWPCNECIWLALGTRSTLHPNDKVFSVLCCIAIGCLFSNLQNESRVDFMFCEFLTTNNLSNSIGSKRGIFDQAHVLGANVFPPTESISTTSSQRGANGKNL